MKAEKTVVNQTAEQPDGIEIEMVTPESDLDKQLLSYLLASHVRELKQTKQSVFDLPENFIIEHGRKGMFFVKRVVSEGEYYEPPRPVAIVGIRVAGNRFDLIHAPVPAASPSAEPTVTTSSTLSATEPIPDIVDASDPGDAPNQIGRV